MDLRNLLGEFQRGLGRLNLPKQGVATGWFSDVANVEVAHHADDLINRSLADLGALTQMISQTSISFRASRARPNSGSSRNS